MRLLYFDIYIALCNDLDFCSHTAEGKFLVDRYLRGGPAVEPFCRTAREIDTTMRARPAEIVMPESAVEGDAAFGDVLHPGDAGQVETAGGNVACGHVA